MTLFWVVFLLFEGRSVALESTQASTVSQRCMDDTNSFLWEIKQDRPKEYAVLSKCRWLLKGFFSLYVVESPVHLQSRVSRFKPIKN